MARKARGLGIDFVLWDHDGVLVDTEPTFFEATQSTLGDFGVEVSQEHWVRCQARGRGLGYIVAASSSKHLDVRELRRLRNDLYDKLLEANDVVIEGAAEVLGQVAEHFRMALVTTSERRVVDRLHANTSMLQHFECIITDEDCSRRKPSPDPYLRAMELLGATAARSVAVEDSRRGLTSATTAGLRCFIVRSEFMARSDFDGAHAVLNNIRELPPRLAIRDRL